MMASNINEILMKRWIKETEEKLATFEHLRSNELWLQKRRTRFIYMNNPSTQSWLGSTKFAPKRWSKWSRKPCFSDSEKTKRQKKKKKPRHARTEFWKCSKINRWTESHDVVRASQEKSSVQRASVRDWNQRLHNWCLYTRAHTPSPVWQRPILNVARKSARVEKAAAVCVYKSGCMWHCQQSACACVCVCARACVGDEDEQVQLTVGASECGLFRHSQWVWCTETDIDLICGSIDS